MTEPTNKNAGVAPDAAGEIASLRARVRALEHQLATPRLPDTDTQTAWQRAEDFAATMNGWFWETDAAGRFTYLSQNVERISGLSAKWHIGKTRRDIGCPASISADEWRAHLETIDARRAFSGFVYRRHGPDGDTWLRVNGNPVFDKAGEFFGYRGTAEDVSGEIRERDHAIRLTTTIEEKNRILEATLRTIPDGVRVVDQYRKMVAWNDQLFEVLGLDKTEILSADDPGLAFFDALAQRGEYDEGDADRQAERRLASSRSSKRMHFESQLVTGKWIECRGGPIAGGSFLAVYRDITETRNLIDRLEQQASVDPLTGALNRRKFIEIAGEEFSRARRYDRPLAFVVFDIDHFKAVNDTHGHAAGDEVLRRLVATCRLSFRVSDRIGRFGGEEFVLLLPETDAEGAATVAERLRQTTEALRFDIDGAEFAITISAGTVGVGPGHGGPEEVIADADAALYEAKHAGRNRVVSRLPGAATTFAGEFSDS